MPIPEKELSFEMLASMACKFDLGAYPFRGMDNYCIKNHNHSLDNVYVEFRGKGWSLSMSNRYCFSKKHKDFGWEPMPSSRTDAHYEDIRFKTAEEAIRYYRNFCAIAKKKIHEESIQVIGNRKLKHPLLLEYFSFNKKYYIECQALDIRANCKAKNKRAGLAIVKKTFEDHVEKLMNAGEKHGWYREFSPKFSEIFVL